MQETLFRKTVLYSALVGLFYQAVCGIAVVFRFTEFYLWLRFYPFPVSVFWHIVYVVACFVAFLGIWFFLRKKKNGIFIYFLGKILMLIFLLHAFMVKFAISYTEPFIETYLAGIGAWMIYPVLIFVLLKTENHHNYERANQ
jgi:hypothetical protein